MFQRMTDHPADGHFDDVIDRDRLLTNVTLYWLTGTAGSAAQVYFEDITASDWVDDGTPGPTTAPTRRWATGGRGSRPPCRPACWCPGPATSPSGASRNATTVVHWAGTDSGGHFFAMERPDLFVADLRTFFGSLR